MIFRREVPLAISANAHLSKHKSFNKILNNVYNGREAGKGELIRRFLITLLSSRIISLLFGTGLAN